MVEYNYSFEGGTDGANTTSGGGTDAGGDIPTSRSVGTNGTMTFSAAAAMRGALGCAMTTTAVSVAMYSEYNVTAADRYAMRFYFRFSALPGVITTIGRFRDNQATIGTVASVIVRADNTIGLQNAAGSGITTAGTVGTVPITANAIHRLEVGVNGVTGAAEWKLFLGDSTTVTDSGTMTGQAFGGFPIGKIRLGRVVGSTWIGTIHYDDWKLIDLASGLPGPISNAQTTVRPNGVVTNPGTFINVGGAASLEAALADESDTTYVQSPANPTGAAVTVSLPELASGTVTVNVKHKADTASPPISRVYSLMQGATVINSRTVNPLPTTATAYSWSTDAGETAAITDRTQLRVRWTDTAV